MPGSQMDKDELGRSSIKLPEQIAFRHIKDAKIFAMDIGGSLTKVAYYSTLPIKKIIHPCSACDKKNPKDNDVKYEMAEGARLHFIKFENRHIDQCLDYVSQSLVGKDNLMQDIKITGGGAYKYAGQITTKLKLPIDKCEEIPCIVQGCNFLLRNISDETFAYQRKGTPEFKFQTVDPNRMYPYLLVTIGSGVSVIKVDGDDQFERIGGTATGGGTFWGLGKLLTKAETFDELLQLATEGDHRQADMLVKDIYGDDSNCRALGLPADLIASSFGKAKSKDSLNDSDAARSLLYLISNDIGQISSLYALNENVKTIYFGGFFLRHHPVSMHTVSYAVNFWTKGKVQPLFLRHEGYLGAMGAFLKGAKANVTDEYSWNENMYGSSGFPVFPINLNDDPRQSGDLSDNLSSRTLPPHLDHLEIDRSENKLRFCPLLQDPDSYNADTVDLLLDDEARDYWLRCLQDSLEKFTQRAIKSQENSPNVEERATKFKEHYLSKLERLKVNPFTYGNLTVRSLLDLREHCLLEFDFYDPYLKQKQYENEEALKLLPKRLDELKNLDFREKQKQLAYGVLAGNVFDWGAKEVAILMESKGLDFTEALGLIGPHPWLMDDLEHWIARLENGPVHKCAAIFIDNSGVDVILGILPFVNEMLSRGSQVILCANNKPVLNDVTYAELTILLQKASEFCSDIKRGLASGDLLCLDSGQSSPCLDFSKLNQEVADAMIERQVDLLVLEGMGRAVHTNLYARFNCECLKVAVLKNRWLAEKLGGLMYAIIFRFEKP